MAGLISEIEVLNGEGELKSLGISELGFDYRRSKLPEGYVVISATLKGDFSIPEEVKAKSDEAIKKRRVSYPVNDYSAGMIFFKSKDKPAVELIDGCGLKGVRVGEAEVSRLHANFIVNMGKAEAGQIVSLMGMIQERVYVKHKIKLEPMVKTIGSWKKSKMRISD
jgi:UDP-N-acetylmuramate dehydrogenase